MRRKAVDEELFAVSAGYQDRSRRVVTGLLSRRPFCEDPERLVATEFVRLAADDKRHWLSCFQRRFDKLLGLVDPDLEAAATPLNAEAEAAPNCRQLWVDGYAVALQ